MNGQDRWRTDSSKAERMKQSEVRNHFERLSEEHKDLVIAFARQMVENDEAAVIVGLRSEIIAKETEIRELKASLSTERQRHRSEVSAARAEGLREAAGLEHQLHEAVQGRAKAEAQVAGLIERASSIKFVDKIELAISKLARALGPQLFELVLPAIVEKQGRIIREIAAIEQDAIGAIAGLAKRHILEAGTCVLASPVEGKSAIEERIVADAEPSTPLARPYQTPDAVTGY